MSENYWHRIDVAAGVLLGLLVGAFAGASLVYRLDREEAQETAQRWERLRDAESKVRWLEQIEARKAKKKGYK